MTVARAFKSLTAPEPKPEQLERHRVIVKHTKDLLAALRKPDSTLDELIEKVEVILGTLRAQRDAQQGRAA
jgi:hypothetical protein